MVHVKTKEKLLEKQLEEKRRLEETIQRIRTDLNISTRTITITKEIEEKMRQHIEEAPFIGCPRCLSCRSDEAQFIESMELLKALGIEPSEGFAEWFLL